MSIKVKGVIYGIISAISYGTNPLGALYLYEEGVNVNSVLFHRFSLAAIILAGIMLVQKKTFAISRKELLIIGALGVLFATSSLSLFSSFHYMDGGVACTLLFIYPVIVAVLMAVFFKEKISLITILSIALALAGIGLLYQGDGESTLSTIGVVLVMISAISYSIYIIVVNKSPLMMSSIKLTFYVLLFCILTVVVHSFSGEANHIHLLNTPRTWMWALMLALVPTIISLLTMVKAVHAIGSTPTAIMGALEPVTAVVVGVTLFGELFTPRLAMGIVLILASVMLIIIGKSLKPKKLITKVSHAGKRLRKHFRWK